MTTRLIPLGRLIVRAIRLNNGLYPPIINDRRMGADALGCCTGMRPELVS